MTGSRVRERAARAAELAAERPAAAEMLEFYQRLLTAQEAAFEALSIPPGAASCFLPAGSSSEASDVAAWPAWVPAFRELIARVAPEAPAPLREAGSILASAPADRLASLLADGAARASLANHASALGSEEPLVAFYARAFLQPAAERLRIEGVSSREPATDSATSRCPFCGWPAQVGLLRDEGELRGRRRLVCGLCAEDWAFPRVRCASCEEEDARNLRTHEAEGWDHLRIEECTTCGAYTKTVDLRRLGYAVPVVEDLASPELDLWAVEQGLWKVCPSVMGL